MLPGERQKAACRIFGIKPGLDRRAVRQDGVLRERERLARRHAELPFDEIETGNRLGDRVLDLQPGIHLHEIEGRVLAQRTAGNQELDGAGPAIGDLPRRLQRSLGRPGAQGIRKIDRRRLLDDFLAAPLQRAFALEKVNRVAVIVAEHLHLDMPGRLDQLLHQQPAVAESRLRLAAGARRRIGQIRRREYRFQTLAATPGHRLEHHRIADALGLAGKRHGVLGFAA